MLKKDQANQSNSEDKAKKLKLELPEIDFKVTEPNILCISVAAMVKKSSGIITPSKFKDPQKPQKHEKEFRRFFVVDAP